MDYEEKYKEALGKAEEFYNDKDNIRYANAESMLEEIFPELKESEDEKVREYLIRYIDNTMKSSELKSKLLAWLEKQGQEDSQIKLPTFTFDDILALQCCMETVKKVQEDKDLYNELLSLHNKVHDAYTITKR